MKYLGKLWEYILQNNKLNQKLNACFTNFIYIHIHVDVPVLPLDYLYKIDDSYQYVLNDCEKTNVSTCKKFSFYAARIPFALRVL